MMNVAEKAKQIRVETDRVADRMRRRGGTGFAEIYEIFGLITGLVGELAEAVEEERGRPVEGVLQELQDPEMEYVTTPHESGPLVKPEGKGWRLFAARNPEELIWERPKPGNACVFQPGPWSGQGEDERLCAKCGKRQAEHEEPVDLGAAVERLRNELDERPGGDTAGARFALFEGVASVAELEAVMQTMGWTENSASWSRVMGWKSELGQEESSSPAEGAPVPARTDEEYRAKINRDRWRDMRLNGGAYIDDPEDRTNYLLDRLDDLLPEV